MARSEKRTRSDWFAATSTRQAVAGPMLLRGLQPLEAFSGRLESRAAKAGLQGLTASRVSHLFLGGQEVTFADPLYLWFTSWLAWFVSAQLLLNHREVVMLRFLGR